MEVESDSLILTDPVIGAACPKCKTMLDVEGLPAFASVQCPACEHEFQVPARLGPFLLLQLLGAGGMGGVYLARDEALEREVAIKVMLKRLGDDPKFVETFQREAQAVAKLNHPNIAQIYSFGQEKGQPYIVMELVPGGSFDRMIAEQGAVPPAIAMHIGRQIAEGLQEAANAGMVHGDVKPENILFDNDQNAKLVDFGLSAMASGPGNEVWGTPYYIAPEKVRRQKSDYRSDIYSLGGTLYHAIAGIPPFEGEDATAVVKARFEAPARSIREIRKNIPEEVDAIVLRMLAEDPQTRYPTYGSLLGDMKRFLSKAGPVRMKKSSRKIIIKGKGVTSSKLSGSIGDTGALSEITPSGSGAVEDEEEEVGDSRRGVKLLFAILGVVLLIGAVGFGIYFGITKYMASNKEKLITAQIVKVQSDARAAIARGVETARTAVTRVKRFVPEAEGFADEAAAEVVRVLGDSIKEALVPPVAELAVAEEVAPPPAAEKEGKVAEADQPAKEGGDDAAKAGGEEAAKAEVAADHSAKEGENDAEKAETSAESKKDKKAKSEKKPDVAVAEAPKAAQPEAGAVELELPENITPEGVELINTVREMYQHSYAVKAGYARAEQILAQVQSLASQAETMVAVEKEVAEELAKTANQLVEIVRQINYDPLVGEMPRLVTQLQRMLEGVKSGAATVEANQRLAAAEEVKRKEAARVAALKEKEREEYAARVAEEKAMVTAKVAENIESLKQLRFRDILGEMRKLETQLETKEAQVLLSFAMEKVSRVQEFHEYLVKKVPGFKSARGWSIESADNRSLSVGGRRIMWVDVYNQRMDIIGELVAGLVMDNSVAQALKLREYTRLMTNAAICLTVFYSDVPSAIERARDLATSAAKQFELDAESIKNLLPEYFE